MKVEWLALLAEDLRDVLASFGQVVAHAEALDLVAAVPDLRDWSEVTAFPDRVAASRLDDEATERIASRIAGPDERPIELGRLLFRLRTMSLFHQSSTASTAMKRLIVTTSDSGAGHLKQSRIADNVIRTHAFDSLVSGPVPRASDPAAFFAAREAAYDRDPWVRDELYDWNRPAPALRWWREVVALCEAYERVELWIGPQPDEQLRLLQVLGWLGRYPCVTEKLHVVHEDEPLGERCAEDIRTLQPRIEKVGDEALALAGRAWDAWCAATPTAWFDLLDDDLDVLPSLRRTVLLLLGELPAVGTGLGATERLLLTVVAPGEVKPMRFFHANTRNNPACVFGYFDEIRIVNRLGRGPMPALLGLHDSGFAFRDAPDEERRKRYMQSALSLSPLGRSLVAGTDDFARHNPIHRWWGGTLLTNDHLWRWEAGHRRLVPPPA